MLIHKQKNKPPRFSSWVLKRFLMSYSKSPALGDLEEEFELLVQEVGWKRARRWYRWQVLRSLPSALNHIIFWSAAMYGNYVKIVFRTMKKQKVYSSINIAGLAIGMACFILISIWIKDELSYDQFHQNRNRLFRPITKMENGDIWTTSSWALGPALKDNIPEVQEFSRIWFWHRSLVKYQDKRFDEERFYLADPSIFTMFTFPFIKGEPETALADLNSIVITEETARRYFGDQDPMGQVLHVAQNDADFTVTGVIENIPSNSHLQFDLVARIELMGQRRLESWEFTGYSYVMLYPGVSTEQVAQKVASFYSDFVNPEVTAKLVLQPLTRIHLYASGKGDLVKQVTLFSIVAVFILLIACVNFMSLSSARSVRRAKEVGMRKVTGAIRAELIKQFLGESVLFSYLALVLAMMLVVMILPAFNRFTGKALNLSGSGTELICFLFFLAPLTGLLAGSYPAFVLSSYRPALAVKGQSDSVLKGSLFRKLLVVFQFSISIGLIICTMIVYGQIRLIQNKNLGFERNCVVTLRNNSDLMRRYDAFKHTLLTQQGVFNVTAAATRPTDVGQRIRIDWEGHQDEEMLLTSYTVVDYDFFATFEMELVQGRCFSKDFITDETEACIINETALKTMNLEAPLGKSLYFNHPAFEESSRHLKIIGIVKDFHFRSMHQEIGPFLFRIYKPWWSYIFVKIASEDVQESVNRIHRVFREFAPDYPFQFQFLDEAFNDLYQSERRLSQFLNVFGFLAIFISCLGLFGLASYTAEQKTKEIGVRKVLGASVSGVVLLLSKEFTKWVVVANLIAWPVAYLFMKRWLQDFAYRIDLRIDMFIIAALLAMVIAFLTVSYQAVKAALANPVDSLKYE